MSLVEQLQKNDARVLIFDCETSPTLTYTFGMRPKWISPEKIVEPSRVLCYGAQWVGEKRKLFHSEHHHDRPTMIRALWDLFDEADVVVGWNSIRFDDAQIRREWFEADLNPPRPWKDVDLMRAAKSFAFESHSLNHVAQRLGVGKKVEHSGFDLWRKCLAGDKAAWAQMKAYQLGDIDVTLAVYVRMLSRGWLPNHPHVGRNAFDDQPTCNACGSADLVRNGTTLAQQIVYVLYRCQTCGSNIRGGRHSRAAVSRGVR